MRKNIAIVLCAMLLLLSGCSANPAKLDPKNPVTITLWHYYHGVQQNAMDDLVKEFNDTEGLAQGIILQVASYGGVNDLADAVRSAAHGEPGVTMPDIFSSYSDSVYELAGEDVLVDLDQYFTEDELAEYVSGYIENGRMRGGKLYNFPVAKSMEIIMLNKTDWDAFAAGAAQNTTYPSVELSDLETWEGLLTVAETYYRWTDDKTPAPDDGKAFFGLDSVANFNLVAARQLGTPFVDADRQSIVLEETTMRKIWDTYYVPTVKGYFSALGRFRSDDVKTGDLLCFAGASTSAAYFPTQVSPAVGNAYNIDAIVMPYPVFEAGEKTVIQQGAGMCVAKSNPKQEYAAVQFLKWFTQSGHNTFFAVSSAGYFPVKNEAVSRENFQGSIGMLSSSSEKSDQNLGTVIEVCLEQLSTHVQYAAPAIEGSADFRILLDDMGKYAEQARASLLERVSADGDFQTELEDLTNEEAFQAFLGEFRSRIQSL